jgi:hypothetical protein
VVAINDPFIDLEYMVSWYYIVAALDLIIHLISPTIIGLHVQV